MVGWLEMDWTQLEEEVTRMPLGNGRTLHMKSIVIDNKPFALEVEARRTYDIAICDDCGSPLIAHIDHHNDEVIRECPDEECNRWTRELQKRKRARIKALIEEGRTR